MTTSNIGGITGLDVLMCEIPAALPENPTEEQMLNYLGNLRTYRLCQIQSAQKHMEMLASELSKDSVIAGVQTRNCIRQFREIEMAFLSDIRARISKIVNKQA